MTFNIIQYLSILVILFILDAVWLGIISKKHYQIVIKNVQGSELEPRILPAIFTYLIMALGLYVFVFSQNEPKWQLGALFGFIVYGVFNGTTHAMFKEWNLPTAVRDCLWGTFAFGLTTQIVRTIKY
jgi:uncharacterized membrane protein